jgi:hypothetical protein
MYFYSVGYNAFFTQILDANGLSNATDKHFLMRTAYDAPWIGKGRRDEVMLRKIEVKGESWEKPFEN